MGLTIKNLHIGDTLYMGKYSANRDSLEIPSIRWLKATPNGDFITADVVDYLVFDAREPYYPYGNNDFALSNICSFLNSDEVEWFHKTHEDDREPAGMYGYTRHYGFLYHFCDYEIESIQPQLLQMNGQETTVKIRLPSSLEIFSGRFNLFKKKGVRAHPTQDLFIAKRPDMIRSIDQYTSYCLLSPAGENDVCSVHRTAMIAAHTPCTPDGIRPTCRLKLDTKVEQIGEKEFLIVPFDPMQHKVATDDDILKLFGLC